MKCSRVRLWMLLLLVCAIAVPLALFAEKRRRDRLIALTRQCQAYNRKAKTFRNLAQISRDEAEVSITMAREAAEMVDFMKRTGKPYHPPYDEKWYKDEAAKALKDASVYASLARKYEQAVIHPERPVAPDPPLNLLP